MEIKKLFLGIIVVLFISCEKRNSTFIKKDTFIKEAGLYYSKSINIIVKEYKDGSLNYGVSDKKNKILYQQSIFSSFNKNQYWFIFVDEKENIWFYSSDIQSSDVLINNDSKSFIIKNFCGEKVNLPKKLLNELSPKGDNFCFN